jgi:hypothetical protein
VILKRQSKAISRSGAFFLCLATTNDIMPQ